MQGLLCAERLPVDVVTVSRFVAYPLVNSGTDAFTTSVICWAVKGWLLELGPCKDPLPAAGVPAPPPPPQLASSIAIAKSPPIVTIRRPRAGSIKNLLTQMSPRRFAISMCSDRRRDSAAAERCRKLAGIRPAYLRVLDLTARECGRRGARRIELQRLRDAEAHDDDRCAVRVCRCAVRLVELTGGELAQELHAQAGSCRKMPLPVVGDLNRLGRKGSQGVDLPRNAQLMARRRGDEPLPVAHLGERHAAEVIAGEAEVDIGLRVGQAVPIVRGVGDVDVAVDGHVRRPVEVGAVVV